MIFITFALLSLVKIVKRAKAKQSTEEIPMPKNDHFFLNTLLILSSAPIYPAASLTPIIYWLTSLS